ncbi:hypothetical protein QAD02_012558 [Eretmocerus hayati]|uniref:Uncharacterized protein n=1 Tax=Eretmocerus hayati TaxID=131215 RepID=A0ACC2P141_9HYME|nr:hypothetical protein QAD02_012558 [Eretmocerus hayati]
MMFFSPEIPLSQILSPPPNHPSEQRYAVPGSGLTNIRSELSDLGMPHNDVLLPRNNILSNLYVDSPLTDHAASLGHNIEDHRHQIRAQQPQDTPERYFLVRE